MFKAVGKLLKTIGYALSGRINEISEIWGEDPYVIGEKYNRIIEEKKARYQTITRAVSRLMTSLDKQKRQLENYREQADIKDKVLKGAKIAGRQRAQELKKSGADLETIKNDPKIKEFAAKSADARSSLELLKADIANLEADIEDNTKELRVFESDIKGMQRDFQAINQERDRAMAKVSAAKERKEMYELKAGISNDETTELLKEVRDSVSNIENTTKLAAKTSGYENAAEEQELIRLAESGGDEEFFSEIGLVDDSPAKTQAPKESTNENYQE